MREITKITYNRLSGTYSLHLFDEAEGWIISDYPDLESLVKATDGDVSKLNPELLDSKEQKVLTHLLSQYGIPSNSTIQHLNKYVKDTRSGESLDSYMEHYLDTRIFYITDVHLDSKIDNPDNGPNYSTEEDVINQCVQNLSEDFYGTADEHRLILIGGDVSHHFERVQKFYEKLSSKINGRYIVAVLGNHELWQQNPSTVKSINSVYDEYEIMFNKMYITFLNESLVIFKKDGRYMVRGDELLNASVNEIREFATDGLLILFGGVGFSGKNNHYNFSSGIYNLGISSREEEMKLSERFSTIYEKVLEALGNDRVVVLTHMPMEDWSDLRPNPTWAYVCGHTHRNNLILSSDAEVYADNQTGYGGTVHLKSFYNSRLYDLFRYREDGIHEISLNEYRDFYHNKRMRLTCNRKGKYYMVKRDGIYCFFIDDPNRQRLYLLDGGTTRSIPFQNLNYYFDNLPRLTNIIRRFTDAYNIKLNSISEIVKSIGGSGKIHGCIIDIDFYNHLYLNPFDNTVTAYTATDIVNKYIYGNFETLLKNERKDLYLEYRKVLKTTKSSDISILKKRNTHEGYYRSTDIYSVSRILYSLQHLTVGHVLRRWDDMILHTEPANDENIVKFLISKE